MYASVDSNHIGTLEDYRTDRNEVTVSDTDVSATVDYSTLTIKKSGVKEAKVNGTSIGNGKTVTVLCNWHTDLEATVDNKHVFKQWESSIASNNFGGGATITSLSTKTLGVWKAGTVTASANTYQVNIRFGAGGKEFGIENNKFSYNDYGFAIDKQTGKLYIKTIPYGSMVSSLPHYPSTDNFHFYKDGYHAKKGAEWIKHGGRETFAAGTRPEGQEYNASDFCFADNSDCNVNLSANWEVNSVSVKYVCNDGRGTEKTETFTYDPNYNSETSNRRFNSGCTKDGKNPLRFYENSQLTSGTYYSYNSPVTNNWINKKYIAGGTVTLYAKYTTPDYSKKIIRIKYHANGGTSQNIQIDKDDYLKFNGRNYVEYKYTASETLINPLNYLTKTLDGVKYSIDLHRAWALENTFDTTFSSLGPVKVSDIADVSSKCDLNNSNYCEIVLCAYWEDFAHLMIGHEILNGKLNISVYSPNVTTFAAHIVQVHIAPSTPNFNKEIQDRNVNYSNGGSWISLFDTGYETYLSTYMYKPSQTPRCGFTANVYHCEEGYSGNDYSNANKVGYNSAGGGVHFFSEQFDVSSFDPNGQYNTLAVCVVLGQNSKSSHCTIISKDDHSFRWDYLLYHVS